MPRNLIDNFVERRQTFFFFFLGGILYPCARLFDGKLALRIYFFLNFPFSSFLFFCAGRIKRYMQIYLLDQKS